MRILFITATRVGDAILSGGLAAELARRHPEARFTVACGPAAAPLFRGFDRLDRLIVVRKRRRGRHWLDLWRQVALRRWDLVVDLRRSALPWLLWTRRRAAPPKAAAEHKVVTFARTLGFDPPPGPAVWTRDEDHRAALGLLGPHRPVLALAPTANWAGKVWPCANFVDLVARLTAPTGALPGARVFVTGGAGEADQVRPLLEAIPDDRLIRAFGLDLPATAAAFQRCRLFVGNDSGLMHLAAAAGTPTVGLFGPTDDRLYAPWGAACRVVRTPESKSALVNQPGFDFKAAGCQMTSLTVGSVLAAADELLTATADGPRGERA
jgi:ADP-heptose:LPS heptosyltransferase